MTKKQESKGSKEEKPSIHSADDLIVKMEAEKLGKPIPEIAEKKEQPDTEQKPEPEEKDSVDDDSDKSEHESEEPEETQESPQTEELQDKESDSSEGHSQDDEVDEYGTRIGKPKTYTEEEVQAMIRKRLRDRHQENQPNAEVQQAAKDFQPDPDSNESWEAQLESFIDKTIEKRETRRLQDEWKREEEVAQTEFEIRFTEGMAKYKDFKAVVANKAITNAMMLATRSMKDPAAFIYAAAKQHGKKLEEISQIKDPVHQATEIGRLEERMKKGRVIPQSPKPAKRIVGDASSDMPQVSIDTRIAAHAKEILGKRR